MKILKENGTSEDFDIAKVEASIRNIGRDDKTAKEIAKIVSEKKSESTKEIRNHVSKELRHRNAEAARNYEESRSAARRYIESRILVATTGDKVVKGTALLPKQAMANLNLEEGDHFMVMHGTQSHMMMAKVDDNPSTRWNEIRLHASDLDNIGAAEGRDIIAQRNIV